MTTVHSMIDGLPVCGSDRLAEIWRSADCEACEQRMDELAELLLDAAEGMDVRERAADLVRRLELARDGVLATAAAGGAI